MGTPALYFSQSSLQDADWRQQDALIGEVIGLAKYQPRCRLIKSLYAVGQDVCLRRSSWL